MKWTVIMMAYAQPDQNIEADAAYIDNGTLSLINESLEPGNKLVALFAPGAWAACIQASEGQPPQ